MTKLDLGWLSPTGKMYKCGQYGHFELARQICTECGYQFTNYLPDEDLMSHGWVLIMQGEILDQDYHIHYNTTLFLTPEQIRYLKPYYEDNDCPIDETEREIFFERLELM